MHSSFNCDSIPLVRQHNGTITCDKSKKIIEGARNSNSRYNMSSITTPDAKKKKIALPSVLSNIRNAVGRAGAEEKGGKSEVEIRPLLGSTLTNRSSNDLVGVGKTSSYAADRSQMRDRSTVPSSGVPPPPLSSSASPPLFGLGQSSRQTLPARNVPSASVNNWSATLQTYSERIGSQWRKRNRRDSNNNERRRRRGVTINTQPILIVLGLFFIGFPILFTLFLLARKAVFGDEGVDNVAKHEVPAHEVLNDGLDTGVSPGVGEETGITASQVLNDLKQLTSEDNPLGSFENDAETINAGEGSVNDAVVNEMDANNQAVLTTEANINVEVTNEMARESETMDNASNLRGSKEETNRLQDQDHEVSLAVIDKGGGTNSFIENENQPAPMLGSDHKAIVESTMEKEITNEDSMVDEKVINSDNTAVEQIIVQEDEKPLTNNEQ